MINLRFLKIFQPYLCNDIIRLGKDYDGGYLVNKQDILESKKLINIGVGSDCSFEKSFTEINDCSVVSFDGTIDSNQDFIKEYHVGNKTFINKNVGNKSNEIAFPSILTEPNSFLKCDIEGGEYDILDDIIKSSGLLKGMVIEFHGISNQDHFNNLLNFIGKVNLKLIHIHVNNYFYYITDTGCIPDIVELSFSASDNLIYDKNIQLPHTLDMPNCPDREEFKIYF
jgi:hypothetical protein